MTPTDDREIDARIAEKVFGWVIKKRTRMYAGTPGCFDLIKPNTDRVETAGTLASLLEIYIPKYTTNASDSKALRDRLAEDHPTTNLIRKDGKFQFCWYDGIGVAAWDYGPWADTEEMAVALAALKAVGVEL